MNLWPITERELRLNARRPRTYHTRTLTAVVVVLVSLGMLYAGFARVLNPGSAGRGLFLILACVGGSYVVLDGALMTADCISAEKRDGTLALLLLTGLSPAEIVLGKLLSRITHSACCLSAALPPLAIALFLGGVTGSDVIGMSAALLNGLFVSAAVGMFTSSLCLQERRAFGWGVLGSVTLAAGLPALGWGISLLQNASTIPQLFLELSPGGAFLHALNPSPLSTAGVSAFAILGGSHLVGWALLGGASLGLKYSYQRQLGKGAPGTGTAPNVIRQPHRSSVPRRRLGHLDPNPFIGLSRRRGGTQLGITPVLIVFALAWGCGWVCGHRHWLDWTVFVGSMVLLHLAFMFILAVQACRGPNADRRDRILEMLLTTPAGPDFYLPDRLLSLKRQCVRPLVLVLAIDLGLLVAGLNDVGPPNGEWVQWIGAFIVLGAKLIVDLYVLSWVGIWQGLKQSNTGRAVRRTVFYVLTLKWIVLLGFFSVLGLATQGRAFQSGGAAALISIIGYAVLMVMTFLHFGALALSELQDNLRLLALNDGQEQSDATARSPVTHLAEPCRMERRSWA